MNLFVRSFSSLPLIYSRRVVVSYKRKYVHELLVKCLFKLVQEKVWLGELIVPHDHTGKHPLYPMIQPNFYIEELIQNTTSRARMDWGKLTMF